MLTIGISTEGDVAEVVRIPVAAFSKETFTEELPRS
jgi:hypothetical protein